MKKTPARILARVAAGLLLACSFAANARPLKVFILVGQSNMQGHAHLGTLAHARKDPSIADLLGDLKRSGDAPASVEDVWISYLSDDGERHGRLSGGFGANKEKIGPELSFGISMQRRLGEPFLIIKAAWGGKSLHTDFRPPGAGPYEFSETQLGIFGSQGKDLDRIKAEKKQATGHFYRLMVNHVKRVLADINRVYPDHDPTTGHEIAGFVWFQGWNDMVDRGVYPNRDQPGGYDDYSRLLSQFIRDVRKDLDAPRMPFVIGVMGVNGPVGQYPADQRRYAGIHQNFRDAMAAPAARSEFVGTVAAVLTEKCWDLALSSLRSREARVRREINQMQKGKKLSGVPYRSALSALMNAEFSASERDTLENGVSNAEYHYLGSAKIMLCIGNAFADAVAHMKSQ